MANLGCAGRTLIPIAIGCLVTAVVLAHTTKPALSTVRLKPDTTYNATANTVPQFPLPAPCPTVPDHTVPDNSVPQIPLPEQDVVSGFSRTVDAIAGLGPTVPGHTVPDNNVPQIPLPEQDVVSGFSRTVDAIAGLGPTVPGHAVPDSNVPQIPLPEQDVVSGFSRTVDAISGLGPTVPGHTVPDNNVPDNNVPQVLLSRHLMREAGVRVGDVVTLAAEADGSGSTLFRVAGVYEPTPDPRKFSAQRLEARLHLADLIALAEDAADPASGDVVSAINLALVDRKDADAVAAAIVRRVPGSRVASTQPSNSPNDPFAVLERFHWAIAIVTVTGSTAFLLALMVMRAEQRRDIIGILRLLGVPSRSILLEVLLEGLLIALGGAIFGIAMAVAAQGAINRFFQWRFDTTLVFVRVTGVIAWQAVAFAVPLGVAAGLAASWTLMRRSVVSLVGR